MPGRNAGKSVDVFVEIPRGSRAKYELDQKSGRICLDRVLFSSVHYPADYGFIVDTKAGDGDPLDALVVVEEPTFPGCILAARPIGTLLMTDSKGEEIENFFASYKTLESDPEVRLGGWRDARVAWSLIEKSRAAHGSGRPRGRG